MFIHVHKAGGSFISGALRRFDPSARFVGYHYPLALLQPEYRDKPIVSSVRHPADSYVSYYFFQLRILNQIGVALRSLSPSQLDELVRAGNDPRNGLDVVFEEASANGLLGFPETTARLLTLGTDDSLLKSVLNRLPSEFNRRSKDAPPQRDGFRGMNLREVDLIPIRTSSRGLFSFLTQHLLGDQLHGAHFLRFESLRSDFLDLFEALDLQPSRKMVHFVKHSERLNTSTHRPYQSYYHPALFHSVLEAEAELADRFGYC